MVNHRKSVCFRDFYHRKSVIFKLNRLYIKIIAKIIKIKLGVGENFLARSLIFFVVRVIFALFGVEVD